MAVKLKVKTKMSKESLDKLKKSKKTITGKIKIKRRKFDIFEKVKRKKALKRMV